MLYTCVQTNYNSKLIILTKNKPPQTLSPKFVTHGSSPRGPTLAKHNQDACAVTYADDGYIKAKLSVALEVLSDIKQVLKEDAGLALNDRTKILVKGISVADAHAADQRLLIADPSLAHLSPLLSPAFFVVAGCIGLGVPIGTDAFIQHFVKDKCQAIMVDVDKLDNIQDGFIHYQLIRFCQATRLQYINGHVQLANQNVLHSSKSTTRSHRHC